VKLKDSSKKINATLAKGQDMTKSDIEYLLNKEVTQDRIGKALGTDRNGFQRLWKGWNDPTPRKPQTDKEANKRAKQLVKEGKLSIREISKETGAKFSTVAHYARGRGVKRMKSRVDLNQYNELKAQGKTAKEISAHFGLTESNLYYHLKKAKQEQENVKGNLNYKQTSKRELDLEKKVKELEDRVQTLLNQSNNLADKNKSLIEQLSEANRKLEEQPNTEVHQRTIKRLEETNSTLVQKNKNLQQNAEGWREASEKHYNDMWEMQLERDKALEAHKILEADQRKLEEALDVYKQALKLSI